MSKFCSECGAKLSDSQKFCTECGTKVGGKGKKVPTKVEKKTTSVTSSEKPKTWVVVTIAVAAFLVIALLIGVIAKGISDSNAQKKYIDDVTSYKKDLFKSFQNIESVGNQVSINLYVYSTTGTNKYARYKTVDDAISSALTSKASEVAKVNSEKPGLNSRYEDIIDTKVPENDKIKHVKKELKKVYNAYGTIYKAAIKPAGTPTSMRQDYSEARADFTIKYAALNRALKE
ncbi:MAG: zinc ribbon domain-containing protein [Bacilli bacterium]|nr:zinc ribbon domain-containing protein [Bacilli bacterium]